MRLFFIALFFASFALAVDLPSPGVYQVDPAHSALTFNVTNFLITSVDGHFRVFSGKARFGGGLESMRWEGTVETKSIDTDSESRDHHLRSADFFDADKFPEMRFKSTGVTGTPEAFQLKGDLTIKGITKEAIFDGKLAAGDWLLESKINRQDFGIMSGATIKNEVRLKLQLHLQSAPTS